MKQLFCTLLCISPERLACSFLTSKDRLLQCDLLIFLFYSWRVNCFSVKLICQWGQIGFVNFCQLLDANAVSPDLSRGKLKNSKKRYKFRSALCFYILFIVHRAFKIASVCSLLTAQNLIASSDTKEYYITLALACTI